jgi:signal transduction histidine kinase
MSNQGTSLQDGSPAQPQAELLRRQYDRLQTVHEITVQLGQIAELELLMQELVNLIGQTLGVSNTLLLLADEEQIGLRFGAIAVRPEKPSTFERLSNAYITTFNADDAVLNAWTDGQPFTYLDGAVPDSPISELVDLAGIARYFGVPLIGDGRLAGALIVGIEDAETLSENNRELLQMLCGSVAIVLQNARAHNQAVQQLADKMHEMGIFQQIDRELNDTIALNTVFNMTLDWALRFTNASVGSIALYDEEADSLETMFHWGYEMSEAELEAMRSSENGITYRVARSGRAEVVPDVMQDKDYIPVANNIVSHMSVPVLREDRVIAVITLESKNINAFTEGHQEFVQGLANRAAVAIDNARLYNESERERQKLSYIVSNIGDVVIVVAPDERISQISQSAISMLQLQAEQSHIGSPFVEVIDFKPLVDMYQRTRDLGEEMTDELTLPNERVFYTKVTHHTGIGWIIVMQDVTPYKEMDRLKSELIATVSHDLKQPLSVMWGYLDLLQMKNDFSEQSAGFVNMIEKAITNMRRLIDDLLDLARIESGIDLDIESVSLKSLLSECVDANRPMAETKSQTLAGNFPDDLPFIEGERARLVQIFNNLIGNAVKYTQPGGAVNVNAEYRGDTVRVTIQDNGMGISPEDQAHIFERFYRVRRPETETIEGTGLGLAIVKSLIEAHRGKIRLESRLGEGTTFHVALPAGAETA